jgi:hypothetical protein
VGQLLNGGFEDATNGVPTGWTTDPAFKQANGSVHEGSYSGRFQSVSGTNITINSNSIAISAGRGYTIGGSVYSTDKISISPTAIWKDASGVTLRSDVLAAYTGWMGSWSSFSSVLTAPTGATTLIIQLPAISLNGTIWVDSFSVLEMPQ